MNMSASSREISPAVAPPPLRARNEPTGLIDQPRDEGPLPPARRRRAMRGPGLAAGLLILTISAVLMTQTLIYFTRLAAYHENWLRDRVANVGNMLAVFEPAADRAIAPDMAQKILAVSNAQMIVLTKDNQRHLLAKTAGDISEGDMATDQVVDLRDTADQVFDLRQTALPSSFVAALRSLFAAPGSFIKVIGEAPNAGGLLEITFDEAPVVKAMVRFSTIFLGISLLLSALIVAVLWFLIWLMVLRPMRRLTSNIMAFGERPQDTSRIIAPSGRSDEIGRAERALASMQTSLAGELAQKKRLAELGLAVARINHDLRNMLASAQLISDRLASIPDPLAMRLAPRLVATLDRAIAFCESTLTYGGAVERAPKRAAVNLLGLIGQIVETAKAGGASEISFDIAVDPQIEIYADPDQIHRVLENLNRNAVQALGQAGPQPERPAAIKFSAQRALDGVTLEIADTGPGIPARLGQGVFKPFHFSSRDGGSGLGLTIAAELVEKNGGSIVLAASQSAAHYSGARFILNLPAPPTAARPREAPPMPLASPAKTV